ncbi:MAG: hypothetical protein L0I66_05520 [Tetragenococcus halophilus]|uniref:Uncharacterized protein n=1 Tax=Tetragenococcus halophilus TaxID=51669 RepID=A0AB35HP36_TETHA|nr:hypothetical protein [Tetragenococcus halophilus]MCO7026394.1 hypothetical protein [Tetragenococcus halophilus]MCO8290926.1 hypothetical protein [Tetragenococcus halophilus]MCO8293321.1 hypothetical protein [Tetragenococcus halophilus]MCO8296450.1 hypothetical protein [Tetragenococcus halophilus]MCO8297918.1 hypothetical protein [Tetragenococcus halophilus]
MDNDNAGNAIQRTLRNTIHREIGCFTDEVNKADRSYFSTNVESKRFDNFFNSIEAVPFNGNSLDITEKDLLIVFDSSIREDSELYNTVKSFKTAGGHVAAILVNRNINYMPFVDEVLGININQSDIEAYEVNNIFRGTVKILLDEVDKKVFHFDTKKSN